MTNLEDYVESNWVLNPSGLYAYMIQYNDTLYFANSKQELVEKLMEADKNGSK